MSVTIDTSCTGSNQTGFTSPTYTLTVDKTVKETNGYVTAIGGTQAGVRVHSISDPFKISVVLPQQYRTVSNPINGVLANQPKNVTRVRILKGGIPLSGYGAQLIDIDCQIKVPAGVDANDAPSVRAALSMLIGQLTDFSAGLGDTCVQGNL